MLLQQTAQPKTGPSRGLLLACLVLAVFHLASISAWAVHPEISVSDDQTLVTVGDAPEQEVIVFGKSVLVSKRAQGVLSVGGDVIVEGRVEGDVATVGGNIIQRKDAYIGGDVIVFGGAYKPESDTPLRGEGKETIMFGVFEEELRSFGQDPSQLFAPSFSVAFVAQRLVLVLFWFVVSMFLATIAPGAIGRAVARVQLSFLKVSALGAVALLLLIGVIIGGVMNLPDYLSVTVGLLGSVLLFLGYVFGRVALQVSVGKLFQKHFLSPSNRSETLAILIGVLIWTAVFSLPYLWVIALFAVFAIGIGLVLTGRSVPQWQNP